MEAATEGILEASSSQLIIIIIMRIMSAILLFSKRGNNIFTKIDSFLHTD
jgi:hypothetical protein